MFRIAVDHIFFPKNFILSQNHFRRLKNACQQVTTFVKFVDKMLKIISNYVGGFQTSRFDKISPPTIHDSPVSSVRKTILMLNAAPTKKDASPTARPLQTDASNELKFI